MTDTSLNSSLTLSLEWVREDLRSLRLTGILETTMLIISGSWEVPLDTTIEPGALVGAVKLESERLVRSFELPETARDTLEETLLRFTQSYEEYELITWAIHSSGLKEIKHEKAT